jgi:hypothetical protein
MCCSSTKKPACNSLCGSMRTGRPTVKCVMLGAVLKEFFTMQESYGHRIAAIHANPKNLCDHCKKTALWETDYMFYGEHSTQSSHPGQVCDLHAKEFAALWPSIEFRAQN